LPPPQQLSNVFGSSPLHDFLQSLGPSPLLPRAPLHDPRNSRDFFLDEMIRTGGRRAVLSTLFPAVSLASPVRPEKIGFFPFPCAPRTTDLHSGALPKDNLAVFPLRASRGACISRRVILLAACRAGCPAFWFLITRCRHP